ncbi:MBL fold metallo-hydrolase [Pseudobutyrivibrio xylanivorans]|uniref:7,8-dihydropterin-6-yl-methyl-4-(Beta-D-ribofuranosyl)aminobenzene 5'-phosphate synthase n=1 Tax=Pseudobutyrivibrio xylanivorans DSM 14809 TaxID=1123012 RepID=A0A1M6IAR0_PSEXY|nr:MBL fold metallo-hydrolase [Pseudobutyrivibrio xylanivorans]SHJ31507.1 7,8-dihydropterin-6-yl-methyl-4-(beta-D-ribofuranosyl)aminobenzene 5'-phosphate synthase [Pseudobutyrivibrio xylanivorans DSM 14809]
MDTKITVTVDNISNLGLEGEWGLCLLVEYDGNKILLDTGASGLFLNNLKSLGFDVADIDYGVLSHAHYDHGNGMPLFFKNNSKAKFYVRDSVETNCYHKRRFFKIYIGIPKKVLKEYPDRIEKVSGDYKIMDGVFLIPHKSKGLSLIGKREKMYVKENHRWLPDDFAHEQSLVIDTDKGLVILNSCSHGGVENIINDVQDSFPEKHIYGYIGGLHLFNKSEEEILEVAKVFKEKNIQYICTGHCTKNRAFGILKNELGDKLEQLKVGLEINI